MYCERHSVGDHWFEVGIWKHELDLNAFFRLAATRGNQVMASISIYLK